MKWYSVKCCSSSSKTNPSLEISYSPPCPAALSIDPIYCESSHSYIDLAPCLLIITPCLYFTFHTQFSTKPYKAAEVKGACIFVSLLLSSPLEIGVCVYVYSKPKNKGKKYTWNYFHLSLKLTSMLQWKACVCHIPYVMLDNVQNLVNFASF